MALKQPRNFGVLAEGCPSTVRGRLVALACGLALLIEPGAAASAGPANGDFPNGAWTEPTLAAAPDGDQGGQGGGEVLALQAACEALDAWTWSHPREQGFLGTLLDELVIAASQSAPAMAWSEAAPLTVLNEASLRVQGRDRAQFALTARGLSQFAPNEASRVRAVRLELRFWESVSVSYGPAAGTQTLAATDDQQAAADARARIATILDDGDYLGDGPEGATGRFRERLQGRLDRLSVGSQIPRFLARDTAGNEVASTRLPGKVTIIRFWDKSSPVSMVAHEQDALLARRFWDSPVALFGSTASGDRDSHIEVLAERAFGGTQLFDGPISVALADELAMAGDSLVHGAGVSSAIGITEAWFKPAPGSLLVVDEGGIIRGRDLHGDELNSLVSTLVAERRARLRASGERDLTGGSSR